MTIVLVAAQGTENACGAGLAFTCNVDVGVAKMETGVTATGVTPEQATSLGTYSIIAVVVLIIGGVAGLGIKLKAR